MSNVLGHATKAQVRVTDGRGRLVQEHAITVSPHGTKIVKLDELGSISNSAGGISISYQGPKNGLVVNGGLEDPSTGYSANIRFKV